VIALVLWIVSDIMANSPLPPPLLIVTGYLFVETSFRFGVAWLIGKPAGSAIGVHPAILAYYYTVANRDRSVSPFAREKGTIVTISETPAERAVTDALLMREALVTLLSPADQARVAARFGYDYRAPVVAHRHPDPLLLRDRSGHLAASRRGHFDDRRIDPRRRTGLPPGHPSAAAPPAASSACGAAIRAQVAVNPGSVRRSHRATRARTAIRWASPRRHRRR